MVDPSPIGPSPAAAPPQSLWALKPWWCQPWSILLTGIAAIAGSWLLLGRLWITIPCAALVLLWWWLFLVLVPAAYRSEASVATGQQRLP
ncbi:MAG: hypothetical protein NTZ53_07165 [Cyanobacteria bacterium]|nr:hypothetical protein [Cyanobacteriota bacterium]